MLNGAAGISALAAFSLLQGRAVAVHPGVAVAAAEHDCTVAAKVAAYCKLGFSADEQGSVLHPSCIAAHLLAYVTPGVYVSPGATAAATAAAASTHSRIAALQVSVKAAQCSSQLFLNVSVHSQLLYTHGWESCAVAPAHCASCVHTSLVQGLQLACQQGLGHCRKKMSLLKCLTRVLQGALAVAHV
jgi:hypothetical protein